MLDGEVSQAIVDCTDELNLSSLPLAAWVCCIGAFRRMQPRENLVLCGCGLMRRSAWEREHRLRWLRLFTL